MRIPHFEFPAKPDWKADEVADASAADFYTSSRALGHLYRRVQAADLDQLEIARPTKTAKEVEDALTESILDRITPEYIPEEELLGASDEVMARIEALYEQFRFELRRMTTLHALHETKPLTEVEVRPSAFSFFGIILM